MVLPGELEQEVVGEHGHVARPLALRRELDGKHIEPVVEVLPQYAFPNGLLRVAVDGASAQGWPRAVSTDRSAACPER